MHFKSLIKYFQLQIIYITYKNNCCKVAQFSLKNKNNLIYLHFKQKFASNSLVQFCGMKQCSYNFNLQEMSLEEKDNLAIISSQKKIWNEEEDGVLKKLYEEEGMRNWSMIAKKMAVQYSLPRKSAKQCRQRYENHISMDTAKVQWTIEEQLMLIQFHNEIGNKWSVIAMRIPGKSDNCVKNHFYSKLRKVLRKLNAVIHTYFRREFRQININVIYKIVEACEEQFKESPGCQNFISQSCRQIQNKMLNLSMLKQEQFDSQERVAIYRQVVREIYIVSKLYKRKSKKSRNSAIQAPNLKVKARKPIIVVAKNQEGDDEQQYQENSSQRYDNNNSNNEVKQEEFESEIEQSVKKMKLPKKKTQIVVKDQEQGIKDMLKEAGLLQYDHSQAQSINGFKLSSKSSFKSYSDRDQSEKGFFEQSDFQRGVYNKQRKRSVFKNIGDPYQKSQGEGPGEFYFNC